VDKHQEIARASNARRLLDDPMFQAAWDKLTRRAERTLLDSPDETLDNLFRAKQEYRILKDLKQEFIRLIETGKLAERQR